MTPSFPGMNPYLENPSLWSEVYSWLIVQLVRSLNPLLIPKYRAAVEKRVYLDALLVGIPDVSVFQQNPEADRASVVKTEVLSKPMRVSCYAFIFFTRKPCCKESRVQKSQFKCTSA
jgi:Protein of unknown function (DUF4058)